MRKELSPTQYFFQSDAAIRRAVESELNNDVQSAVLFERKRLEDSLLAFLNSYCKPLVAEQKATCKNTTSIAVELATEREAESCKKKTTDAVKLTTENAAVSCKNTTAEAVKEALKKTRNEKRWNPSRIVHSRIDGLKLIQVPTGKGFGSIDLDLSTGNDPQTDINWSIKITKT